ncbi:hypothetical protein M23134_00976 [Microscilla marina ATCC 23134]|uniref:Uncharacterized protein n=2 Tax=Microscilla marina TaxID=1027 RepID=A1ZZQ3_MICM2|nr:hypothetical protein M23134_00976 [Microscilla marina ATCC 23134]
MLTWNKFVKGDGFKNTLMKFYDLTVEKKVQSWCFDSRKQRMIAPDDQQWTIDEMVRRGYAGNVIKTAVIMPESLFMELTVDKISTGVLEQRDETSSNMRQFQDRDPALAWLRSDATT